MTHSAYQQQLAAKHHYLQQLFQDLTLPNWEVFSSPEQHYRMRAEFRIWHEGEHIHYAMFQQGQKASSASLIRLNDFPAADQRINQLMPRLLAAISAHDILKQRLYQCEFLATLSGEVLVSLIYHKKLDEAWQTAACVLQDTLGIWVIGRSRGQKMVLTQDFVTERLCVQGREFVYRQMEGSFTQPNARVCEKMLTWACEIAQSLPNDLLELYCGNGNFTLPLAQHFRQVLATEVSKTSVQAAQWNVMANHSHNIAIARLSAEEFAAAYFGKRAFRRLQEQGIELNQYDFSTVFIDPPRAGVDDETLKLVAQFPHIIYISCNPVTLHANLAVLSQTHDIMRCALFDQFPFTHHIESGVWLRAKHLA